MYQLDGKIHLQSEGGPIGLELSGALARVIMLLWDRELLQKLNKAAADTTWDLYTYLRYVDDGNCVAEEAPLGMRFEQGKFIVKQDLIEEDKRCLETNGRQSWFPRLQIQYLNSFKLKRIFLQIIPTIWCPFWT